MRVCILCLLILKLGSSATLSCETDSSRLVARIAELALDEKIHLKLRQILPDGEMLSDQNTSTWTASVMSLRSTRAWHFFSIPLSTASYKDAAHNITGDCLVRRVEKFFKLLKDRDAKRIDREDALKWIVTLMVDMHRPLHCAERNGDDGGNTVLVSMPKSRAITNLHRLWEPDSVSSCHTLSDLTERADALLARFPDAQPVHWTANSVEEWTWETHQLAVSRVYKNVPESGIFRPDEAYLNDLQQTVDEQTVKAGRRLAALLTAALAD